MALYREPRDKRVFVPRKSGGVVLNFGHPIAWAILVCTTIVPFVIVAAVTLAVVL
ncbi:peptide ABC transporter substrate-binding protein [Actinoplanes sp. DH11]|uniref:peptide ABC transporter substrate-binding protein n=1 Tax=Actinoplanes sp. DH11 TaxID=2857011 RepID=UPI001E45BBFB|nr:peptide ABC transporter substrate-binding protein [Actinoplanes sp. DH11]